MVSDILQFDLFEILVSIELVTEDDIDEFPFLDSFKVSQQIENLSELRTSLESFFNPSTLVDSNIESFLQNKKNTLGFIIIALLDILVNSNSINDFLSQEDSKLEAHIRSISEQPKKFFNLENNPLSKPICLKKNSYIFVPNVESPDAMTYDDVKRFLENNLSEMEQLHLLFSIGCLEQVNDFNESKALFISDISDSELDVSDLSMKLKLYSTIVDGETIHEKVNGGDHNFINYFIDFKKGNVDSSQFKDVLQMISEFNAETRTIPKFLTLYQILESFETRQAIVDEMTIMGAGDVLKIRNFNRIVNQSADKEKSRLKTLILKCLPCEFDRFDSNGTIESVKIEQLVQEKWDSYAGNKGSSLDTEIEQLGTSKIKMADYKPNEWCDDNGRARHANLLSEIIYSIRCSIVHYKTNEFHLTDVELDSLSELKEFLANFLVPVMHDTIAALIVAQNSPIIYKSDSLKLY